MKNESIFENLGVKIREKARSFFWHGFWTDPLIFFSFVLAILVNAALWIALYSNIIPTSEPIILHYNVYFGIDVLGDWKSLFFMPLLAGGLLILNLVLSRFFYYKERLAAYLFAGAALVLQMLMGVGVIAAILINF